MIDILKELERTLKRKKEHYKNKSNKGSVKEREAVKILESYFKEVFTVEKRPMQLITYCINIYFQKEYGDDVIEEWVK